MKQLVYWCLCVTALLTPSDKLVSNQATKSYTPIGGRTFEELLNKYLPDHQAEKEHARFAISLRYLPPFSPESQISIVYGYRRQCTITRVTLSRSLHAAINELIVRNDRIPSIEQLSATVQTSTEVASVNGELAKSLLIGLWQAIAESASAAPKVALRSDGTDEVLVLLDPTMYDVQYSDTDKYFRLSLPGPDPKDGSALIGLDPIIRWMITVQRQFETLPKQPKSK